MKKMKNLSNLSIRDFKEMCNGLSLQRFIFCSDNQSWSEVENTVKVKMTFSIMLIAFNPNTICFKNNDNFLCFDKVKNIELRNEESMLGTVFTIVCGDIDTSCNDTSYTMIAY